MDFLIPFWEDFEKQKNKRPLTGAALIIAYPLRFSFQGYREKYDAWVQRRKEAAFQRKYMKAKKNLEQEKKKLEKMEKEKAGMWRPFPFFMISFIKTC